MAYRRAEALRAVLLGEGHHEPGLWQEMMRRIEAGEWSGQFLAEIDRQILEAAE